jgi:glycine C-acetyltransferase
MNTLQEMMSQYDQEHLHKTLADFVLQRREKPDLFAWCQPFYESVDYQYSIGHHMYRRVMLSANANRVIVEDQKTGKPKEMIMMGSNSYLGLNNHPKVKAAAIAAAEKYGAGAGSPPHFSGYYDLHRELERQLSELKGTEDTILYPSGYSTNVGVLSCFLGPKDTIIIDKLAHASIIDGALLSGAKITTFRHNDMDSLERVLIQTKKGPGDRLVVVEGVYSMDGDIAPLKDIYDLVKKHDAKLMVDEAHATGVLGKTGKGSPEHFDLEGKIDLVMGTFSKSLGGVGGFVSAKKEVVRYLRYFSRAYFFAASPTPMQVAAQSAALEVLKTEPQWHTQLWNNIKYFHAELKKRNFDIERTQTAITPIVIGDTLKMREITRFMDENGIFVNPVPYPAVARKKDRLRLSLSALHTREDLDKVLSVLDEAEARYKFAKTTEEEP